MNRRVFNESLVASLNLPARVLPPPPPPPSRPPAVPGGSRGGPAGPRGNPSPLLPPSAPPGARVPGRRDAGRRDGGPAGRRRPRGGRQGDGTPRGGSWRDRGGGPRGDREDVRRIVLLDGASRGAGGGGRGGGADRGREGGGGHRGGAPPPEPYEKTLRVRYRIDGILVDVDSPPKRLQTAIISRVKIMSRLNIAESRLPQDGRIKLRIGGKEIDFRVSTVPTLFGESVVIRILDQASVPLNLETLGFFPDTLPAFRERGS